MKGNIVFNDSKGCLTIGRVGGKVELVVIATIIRICLDFVHFGTL